MIGLNALIFSLCYLTGDSGSGKTSLLNAFVLPALRKRGWDVIETRAWQDPEEPLRTGLAKLAWAGPDVGENTELVDVIAAAAQRAGTRLLLAIDQFEEFIILAKPERQQKFQALIAALWSRQIKKLTLLLILRSDYQAFLGDLGLPPLRQGENFFQVSRFTLSAGSEFMKLSQLGLQPDALDHLLTSAAELDETPGLVRPITLNIVGYVLASGRTVAKSMDAGQLVRRYIEQTINQPAIRDFAPPILEQLITEQGTKRPRSETELAKEAGCRPGEVRAVLTGLGAAALARPLDPRQGIWELSHDFVARAVARHLGRQHGGLSAQRRSLKGLAALQMLSLQNTQVADLKPLQGLAALQMLNLQNTQVANLKPLQGLTALQTLHLAHSQVTSLEALEGLTALQTLNLQNTRVADLEPLKGLTKLQELSLAYTKATSVNPLKGLTELQTLNLMYSRVTNLEPLKGLTKLQVLSLQNTQVANLEPLKGLTKLQTVALMGTKVTTLEPLKGLTALQFLEIEQTPVADLEPLKGLTKLQVLGLRDTQVANLEPLKGLTALQWLDLSRTQVTNLEPVQDLPNLKFMGLETLPQDEVERFISYRKQHNLPY